MTTASPRTTLGSLRETLAADLFRYHGRSGVRPFISSLLREPGYKFTFWMRVCAYLHPRKLSRLGPYWIARIFLSHYRFKFGVHIDFTTPIGPGFYICHVGSIVINRRSSIGKNCNLSHEVTIGGRSRGELAGCPRIGDNVYLGPGAKVIGKIQVGDRAAIGANCVVTKDVPAGAVVVGIPGRVISDRGSEGLVNDVGWEDDQRTAGA